MRQPITELLKAIDLESAHDRRKSIDMLRTAYDNLLKELNTAVTTSPGLPQIDTLERKFLQVQGIVSSHLIQDEPYEPGENERDVFERQTDLRTAIKNDVDIQLKVIAGLRERAKDEKVEVINETRISEKLKKLNIFHEDKITTCINLFRYLELIDENDEPLQSNKNAQIIGAAVDAMQKKYFFKRELLKKDIAHFNPIFNTSYRTFERRGNYESAFTQAIEYLSKTHD